ncbi:MAG: universal stress protein [Bacteroidota bacterium]
MYKIRNILCPTDFSEASIAAIRYSLIYFTHYKATLTLLFVDEYEQTPYGAFGCRTTVQQKHREQSQAFAEEQFRKIIAHLAIDKDRVKTVVRFGAAYKEIVLEAEKGEYSAVFISVLGIGNSTPHLIGRTAERVVRLCRVPVVTLRPESENLPNAVKTILVPTDFSEYSNYSIPYAIAFAIAFHAKLLLLHITELAVSDEYLSRLKFPDLRTYDERASSIAVEQFVTRDIEPDNSIVTVAEDRKVDLIVMGTHGARGMRRTQIGNTTEEVVRRVTVPVLSITHPVHKMIFPRRFNEPLEKLPKKVPLK